MFNCLKKLNYVSWTIADHVFMKHRYVIITNKTILYSFSRNEIIGTFVEIFVEKCEKSENDQRRVAVLL